MDQRPGVPAPEAGGILTELGQVKDNIQTFSDDKLLSEEEISLVRGDEIRHGRALDIDGEGALVVAFPDGHTEAVSSGEVSVRGMYGYV